MPDDASTEIIIGRDRASSDPHNQMRIRAAWLYYIEGMTQSQVAKKLGANRIMITRLLSEARKRGEVVIRIKSDFAPIMEVQAALEAEYGVTKVIVCPFAEDNGDPTRVIAAAAGAHVTEMMHDNMTVGVGWGRTLHAMLPFVEGTELEGVRVVSFLGGISMAKRFNPAEFAWQFAELFDAEGFLIPAPAIVDSVQTKHALLEHCGLEQIFQMAETCDLALLSCGGISTLTTSYRLGHVSEAERQSMLDAGAVGDILYNFLDKDGNLIDHPVNDRAINMSLGRLSRIPNKVLISGGLEKVAIIRATLRSLRPNMLITDEITAKALLKNP